jgi:hypothetical protein
MAIRGALPLHGFSANPAASLALHGMTSGAEVPPFVRFCAALTCPDQPSYVVGCDNGLALLAPVVRQEAIYLGEAAPGAFLYTWQHGTQIAALTYVDADRAFANANPLIADMSGVFGPIYLGNGVNYDMQLRTSTGTLVWFQPNVMAGGACPSIGPSQDEIQAEAFL